MEDQKIIKNIIFAVVYWILYEGETSDKGSEEPVGHYYSLQIYLNLSYVTCNFIDVWGGEYYGGFVDEIARHFV